MNRTKLLQEVRLMRFEGTYGSWRKKVLTQEEVARLLGVSVRTFRRYIHRYEEEGLEGLYDKRINQASRRHAPVDEVMALEQLYSRHYHGFNVKHFYWWYRNHHDGKRSYTGVKNTLQNRGVVP